MNSLAPRKYAAASSKNAMAPGIAAKNATPPRIAAVALKNTLASPMNTTIPPKLQKSFEIITSCGVAASPVETPAEFVRELAQRWKERGGFLSGKPRHS